MAGNSDIRREERERTLLTGPAEALQAAAYTFAQEPIDAVTQAASHVVGKEFKPVELFSKPKEQNWWTAGGSIAGSVGQFIGVSKVLRFGLARAGTLPLAAPVSAMEAGTAGAIMEMLRPVDPKESNFWWAKTRNAGVGFGTFATMTGITNTFSAADMARQAGRRTLTENAVLHGFSGAAGGLVNSELDALGHGKLLPTFHDAHTRMKEYAAFGALFGAADVVINPLRINLKPLKQADIAKAPTTEQWVRSYDGSQPLESPLLTWIAENRPHLRPPGYDAYRAKIATTESTQLKHLDLSAWPVEQRMPLLAEIRQLASGTQLSKDANIDAFISRMNIPELADYSSPARVQLRADAYKQWVEASGRMDKVVQSDPALNEMFWKERLSPEVLGKKPEFARLVDEVRTTEAHYQKLINQHLTETNLQDALGRQINQIAGETRLPKVKEFKVEYGHRDGWYGRTEMGLGESVAGSGHSGNTAETTLHEFVHHDYRPGFLRGLVGEAPLSGDPVSTQLRLSHEMTKLSQPGGTLDLLRRLSDWRTQTSQALSEYGGIPKDVRFYADAAANGEINVARWDETAINSTLRQTLESRIAAARKDAWQRHMNYVGSHIELPAWSTGFLARIRSRALGLPDLQPSAAMEGEAAMASRKAPTSILKLEAKE